MPIARKLVQIKFIFWLIFEISDKMSCLLISLHFYNLTLKLVLTFHFNQTGFKKNYHCLDLSYFQELYVFSSAQGCQKTDKQETEQRLGKAVVVLAKVSTTPYFSISYKQLSMQKPILISMQQFSGHSISQKLDGF